jgi:uncharacterized protein
MKVKVADKTLGIMTWDDSFNFKCYKGISCFNTCCRDITILLTPLDVINLKNKLGMSSMDFLEQYTHILLARDSGLPAVALKMSDDAEKNCRFVTENGCSVYSARPYSCRLYPLDTDQGVEYKIGVDSSFCTGLLESEEWTVERWRKDQDLAIFDDPDHNLKDVMAADRMWEAKIEDPRMQDMILMALYDMDRFREFVFNTTFLQKFRIDDDILEKIKSEDVALLYFGAQWLRFALFGQKGFLKIDKDYLDRKKKEVLSSKRPAK